jgi:hypothetical protein
MVYQECAILGHHFKKLYIEMKTHSAHYFMGLIYSLPISPTTFVTRQVAGSTLDASDLGQMYG